MAAAASFTLPHKATGMRIHSGTDVYIVESFVGQGTFGTVAKCRRLSDSKIVAVKMIKTGDSSSQALEQERSMLEEVQQLDPEKSNLVQWHGAFKIYGYSCFEFEYLDRSLGDFMKERDSQPLELEDIRSTLREIASALVQLESLNIIHADLKPANIMLVDQGLEPFRVKLIDFGLAHKLSSARQGAYIQSLPYRAPEILLGLPYTTSVDMWSLGCIAAFLYQGELLYSGSSQYEMIRYIVQTQGQPENTLLDNGKFTVCYFEKDSSSNGWRLRIPKLFLGEKEGQFQDKRKTMLTSLDDLLHLRPIHPGKTADREASRENIRDAEMFIDLLKGMLQLDPEHRLTPRQVLQHPFITKQAPSAFATSTIKMMKVCCQSEGETGGKRRSSFVRDDRVTSGLGENRKDSGDKKTLEPKKQRRTPDDQNKPEPKRQKRAHDYNTPEPKRRRSYIVPKPSTSKQNQTSSKKRKTSQHFDVKTMKVCCQNEGETGIKRSLVVQGAKVTSGLEANRKDSDDKKTPEPTRQKRVHDYNNSPEPKRRRLYTVPEPSTPEQNQTSSKKRKTSEDFDSRARYQKRSRSD